MEVATDEPLNTAANVGSSKGLSKPLLRVGTKEVSGESFRPLPTSVVQMNYEDLLECIGWLKEEISPTVAGIRGGKARLRRKLECTSSLVLDLQVLTKPK